MPRLLRVDARDAVRGALVPVRPSPVVGVPLLVPRELDVGELGAGEHSVRLLDLVKLFDARVVLGDVGVVAEREAAEGALERLLVRSLLREREGNVGGGAMSLGARSGRGEERARDGPRTARVPSTGAGREIFSFSSREAGCSGFKTERSR